MTLLELPTAVPNPSPIPNPPPPMPRVLVTPHLLRNVPGNYLDILVRGGFDVVYPPDHCDTLPLENITRLLPGMDAMLASTEPLGRDLLAKSQLRVIARMGVGYDAIDIPAATDLKIAVTITPGTLEESVAEHTLALMLGVSRDLCRRDREVRVGIWNRVPFPRMAGRTFGLVGLGRIGRAVVPKVQGLGMKVIAHDPFADREYAAKHHVSLVSLAELFQQADVVSLHAPSTNDTNAMINAESLRQMKRGAILINTSRGALVDEAALAAALQADHLLGAALDVFRQEPLSLESPLLACENALLCTHMGGLDCESTDAASSLAAQCIVDLYHNHWPEGYVVNRELRADWKW